MLVEKVESKDQIKRSHPEYYKGASVVHFLFLILSLFFFTSCTDYVQQISDQKEDFLALQEENSDSSATSEEESSSSVKIHSSSSKISSSVSSAKSSSSSVVQQKSSSSKTQKSSSSSKSVSSSSAKRIESSSSVEYVSPSSVKYGHFEDDRDGQVYNAVTIGSQTWMVENLNYETVDSYCYYNDKANCIKYGRLYTWAAAMDSVARWSSNGKGCGYGSTCSPTYPVRGVCSSGWHLPSVDEWRILVAAVGGSSKAGSLLKSKSWSGGNVDAYAFSVLPAGRSNDDFFDGAGFNTYFWSSVVSTDVFAYSVRFNYDTDGVGVGYNSVEWGLSVRCIKNEGSLSNGFKISSSSARIQSSSSERIQSSSFASVQSSSSTTVSDSGMFTYSRVTYRIVTIGEQIWMAENFKFDVNDSYCYNDSASYCTKYGRLYTWAAAKTACPSGWHLPTKTEFEDLFTAVGGQSVAGKMLKSTSGWNSGGNGTDAYSFSALPVGYRRRNYGSSTAEGNYAFFWSSTEDFSGYPYYMFLDYGNDGALFSVGEPSYMYSVRCVKDK